MMWLVMRSKLRRPSRVAARRSKQPALILQQGKFNIGASLAYDVDSADERESQL
jgi:hypothetical protein